LGCYIDALEARGKEEEEKEKKNTVK